MTKIDSIAQRATKKIRIVSQKAKKKAAKNWRRFSRQKKIRVVAIVAAGVILTILIIAGINSLVFASKIYPGVWMGDLYLGGKTKSEAKNLISQRIAQFEKTNSPIIISTSESTWNLLPKEMGVSFDIAASVEAAFAVGHEDSFLMAFLKEIKWIFAPRKVYAVVDYKNKKLDKLIEEIAATVDKPYKNAGLIIRAGEVEFTPSSTGVELKRDVLYSQISQIFGSFSAGNLDLPLIVTQPIIEKEQTLEAKATAEKYLANPINFIWEAKNWTANREQIGTWIAFKEKQIAQAEKEQKVLAENSEKENLTTENFTENTGITDKNSNPNEYKLYAELSDEKLQKFAEELAGQIDIAPQNAKLAFTGGKVVVKTASVAGRELDRAKLIRDIKRQIELVGSRQVMLSVIPKPAKINEQNLGELGLTELISSGVSSFAGSPRNRIHNIKVGSSKFDGVLIEPDKEFSFNETLGVVDASTGYLPELVIKENKTIPEYGGGLCQVGTTFFRAAVLAGLPILERTNHAYRVFYYDWPFGPGFDATVYPPHPDVKIKNDTGKYILIQTRVEGYRLYFDFIGTKAGRSVRIEGPKILESKADGSMKTIMWSHILINGVEVRKDTFVSNYDSPAKYPHPTVTAPETAPKPQ